MVSLCTFHTFHDFLKYDLFTNKVHTLYGKNSVKWISVLIFTLHKFHFTWSVRKKSKSCNVRTTCSRFSGNIFVDKMSHWAVYIFVDKMSHWAVKIFLWTKCHNEQKKYFCGQNVTMSRKCESFDFFGAGVDSYGI